MTPLLCLASLAVGAALGVLGVTWRLRNDAEVLDLEREEIHAEWAKLHQAQRDHYDELVQWIAQRDEKKPAFQPKQSRWMA